MPPIGSISGPRHPRHRRRWSVLRLPTPGTTLLPGNRGVTGRRLIIRLIIQTIRQDPSRSVWIDGASNVSRPDPSGADQIDAEHQATDVRVKVRVPRPAWRVDRSPLLGNCPQGTALRSAQCWRSTSSTAVVASRDVGATPRATRPLLVHTTQRQPSSLRSTRAWWAPHRATMNPMPAAESTFCSHSSRSLPPGGSGFSKVRTDRPGA